MSVILFSPYKYENCMTHWDEVQCSSEWSLHPISTAGCERQTNDWKWTKMKANVHMNGTKLNGQWLRHFSVCGNVELMVQRIRSGMHFQVCNDFPRSFTCVSNFQQLLLQLQRQENKKKNSIYAEFPKSTRHKTLACNPSFIHLHEVGLMCIMQMRRRIESRVRHKNGAIQK